MKNCILLSFSLFLLLTGCALHQDIAILEERLLAVEFSNQELQKKNQKLQKQLLNDLDSIGETRKSSDRSLRTQVATMNANMDGMLQDVRLLKGRLEELEYVINRKVAAYETSGKKGTERMDEMGLELAKVDQRLVQIEKSLRLTGKTSRGSAKKSAPKAVAAAKGGATSNEIYEQGRKAFDNGNMVQARQLFQQLLKAHPKSGQADNAQFWIGETYFRAKRYDEAALAYQVVIENYPKGNKVPAAMLKQGISLVEINESASAKVVFRKLVQKYPKTSESKIASEKLKSLNK